MQRLPKRRRPTKSDALFQPVAPLAARITGLSREAVAQYAPIVEEILRSGSRDVRHIECTLDGLLDFCFFDRALQLYRRLCRHYFDIDPAVTAFYIDAYREMWDSDGEPAAAGAKGKRKAKRDSRPASPSRHKRTKSGTGASS